MIAIEVSTCRCRSGRRAAARPGFSGLHEKGWVPSTKHRFPTARSQKIHPPPGSKDDSSGETGKLTWASPRTLASPGKLSNRTNSSPIPPLTPLDSFPRRWFDVFSTNLDGPWYICCPGIKHCKLWLIPAVMREEREEAPTTTNQRRRKSTRHVPVPRKNKSTRRKSTKRREASRWRWRRRVQARVGLTLAMRSFFRSRRVPPSLESSGRANAF